MKRPQSKRRRLGSLLAVLAGSSLAIGVLASVAAVAPSAGAQGTSGSAYVEVCKAYTTPTIAENATPTFQFTVTDSTGAKTSVGITAGAGAGNYLCSAPLPVAPGLATVVESAASWNQVTSITEPAGDSYIVGSPDLATRTVQVNVPASNTATVQYTNDPVNGYVEVCKSAPTGSPLGGAFSYDLTGEDGYSSTVSTTVGFCSGPVEVPAGTLTATEAGTNLYVTSIQAAYNAGAAGTAPIVRPTNLQTGTVAVNVKPAMGSVSTQTDIYYTDDVVQFKVCKAWTGGTEPGGSSTTFPFALTASGAAGPSTVPATLSLTAGTPSSPNCSNPTPLRAGTTVTVAEKVVPGTKVQSIVPSFAYSLPATSPFPNGNPDLINAVVQVIVGQPTTGTPTTSVNEATVTFTDQPADPSTLKICVLGGSPKPTQSSYSFAVAGGGQNALPATVVPADGCNVVGQAGSPVLFPYLSTVSINGKGSVSPDVATSITASPQFVQENRGPTVLPVIVPGSLNLGDPSVSVLVSEGASAVTEVDFTIAGAPAAPPSTGGTSTGGTSTGGTSTGGTVNIPSAPSVSSSPSSSSTGDPSSNTSAASPRSTDAKATAALLAKDAGHLDIVKRHIAMTITALRHYHNAWYNASKHHSKRAPLLLGDVQRLEKRLKALYQVHHQLLVAIRKL